MSAKKIDQLAEQRIKDAARIEEVAADLCHGMKRQGTEWTALCPFHGDRRTGNFMISPAKNMAHCFACDATADPVGLVMHCEGLDYPGALHWLARKYGIFVDGDGEDRFRTVIRSQPRPPQPDPKSLPVRFWPQEWLFRYRAGESDAFVRWLCSLPWDAAQRSRIAETLLNYCIGHSHIEEDDRDGIRRSHDFTIFWQTDMSGQVHNGHLMKYGADGRRVKDKESYPTTWIHARMRRARRDPFDDSREQASYCLFGLHLAAVYNDATVNIVESEKTAVVMSVAYGGWTRDIWMACCGVGNLTNSNHMLRPLMERGRRIVLYPDRDGVDAWRAAAASVGYDRMSVNAKPVTEWWKEGDGPKADIADVVLRMIAENRGRKPHQAAVLLDELAQRNENVRLLIDKLELHHEKT